MGFWYGLCVRYGPHLVPILSHTYRLPRQRLPSPLRGFSLATREKHVVMLSGSENVTNVPCATPAAKPCPPVVVNSLVYGYSGISTHGRNILLPASWTYMWVPTITTSKLTYVQGLLMPASLRWGQQVLVSPGCLPWHVHDTTNIARSHACFPLYTWAEIKTSSLPFTLLVYFPSWPCPLHALHACNGH